MEPVLPSVFDEMEQYKPLNYASTGQRFANFVIDSIVYYLFFLLATIVLLIVDSTVPFGFAQMVNDESFTGKIMLYVFAYAVWFILFFLFEGLSKGRTLGKLITGTRAVQDDGSPITWKDAAIRSVSRLIPFEAFSGFGGHPLHDKYSKTSVIKTRNV